MSTETEYSKMSSRQRLDKVNDTLSKLDFKKQLLYGKIHENIKSGAYTIDDLIRDLENDIKSDESELNKIQEVESNKHKIFYPDPCNEDECAMCGKKYNDHFHHDQNKKHRPFCNNF